MTLTTNKSFWLEDIGELKPNKSLTSNKKADVCIIGAGFTGLSTAIHLKEKDPNVNVIVLEKGRVGIGASGRNAGFSMRLFGVTMELTKLRHGAKKTKEADDYMLDAVQYLERMIEKYNIDCDYVREGMMTIASNPQELKSLKKEFDIATSLGMKGFTWLDENETKKLVHSPTYLAARYDENCALLHPAKLAHGLAKVAKELGVNIYENSEVVQVNHKEKIVETKHGKVFSNQIVYATNAYSSAFKKLKHKQVPIYTYITLTEPLTDKQLDDLNWDRRIGIEDARNFLHYYRLTPDNRILLGGSEALYYYGSPLMKDKNESMNQLLQNQVKTIFPQLGEITFTHHWGGPISASLDLIPAIGKIGSNIWYSLGCMGHGVSLSNYNGLTITELLFGEKTKRTNFFAVNRRILPIPPEPLKYVTISGIRAFLRYEDRKGIKQAQREIE